MTPDEISQLPYRPCVGVMLRNLDGRVFVGQRIDNDTAAWQMPQGGIDPGETPKDAALRELWEETGVHGEHVSIIAETSDWVTYDLPEHIIPKIWKGRFRGQKQLWFLMQFQGPDTLINIATNHPEFSKWMWLEPSELVANIVPFKQAVYQQVLDDFADHLVT